jgi:hypothetical protein
VIENEYAELVHVVDDVLLPLRDTVCPEIQAPERVIVLSPDLKKFVAWFVMVGAACSVVSRYQTKDVVLLTNPVTGLVAESANV